MRWRRTGSITACARRPPPSSTHARAVAGPLGVPFAVTRVEVAPGPNLQARARARATRPWRVPRAPPGPPVIATGHTADDRAETLLLRLLRGSGPRGLAAVLPPRARGIGEGSPDLVRPLLGARRRDVLAHLDRHGLPFASDPSNLDPRFARVRVRRELLPLLEDLSPAVVDHLSALADMLAGAPTAGEVASPTAPARSPGSAGPSAWPSSGRAASAAARSACASTEAARSR